MTLAAAGRFLNREHSQLRKLSAEWRHRMPWVLQGIHDCNSGAKPFGTGVSSLMILGSLRSVDGVVQVLDGNPDGWALIDLACLYNAWAVKILARAYEADERPGRRPRVTMETLALAWLHAEAIGETDIRSALDAILVTVSHGTNSIGGRNMNSLCGLVAGFALSLDKTSLMRSGWADPGPYAGVLSGASPNFEELADYHLSRTRGDGTPEFQMNPYSVFPVELLAIERRLGVSAMSEHPLLVGPLAARRTVHSIAATEELEQVIAASRRQLGGI